MDGWREVEMDGWMDGGRDGWMDGHDQRRVSNTLNNL